MPELPSGTVAFLFTDIAGSTRLWRDHPDEMAAVYGWHDALLRGAVAANRGVVYKTIGDAFQVAFPTAAGAVAAALAAQRELAAESWGPVGTVRVRLALARALYDGGQADVATICATLYRALSNYAEPPPTVRRKRPPTNV